MGLFRPEVHARLTRLHPDVSAVPSLISYRGPANRIFKQSRIGATNKLCLPGSPASSPDLLPVRNAQYERLFLEETAPRQNEAMPIMSEDDATEKKPSMESMLKPATQVLGLLLVLAGAIT